MAARELPPDLCLIPGHSLCFQSAMVIVLIISLWAGLSTVVCLALLGMAARPLPGLDANAVAAGEMLITADLKSNQDQSRVSVRPQTIAPYPSPAA
jgi:hypothetical protein